MSATPSGQAGGLDQGVRIGLAGLVVTLVLGCVSVWILGHDDGKPHMVSATPVGTDAGLGYQLSFGLRRVKDPDMLDTLGVTPVRSYSPEADPLRGIVVVGYGSGSGPALLGRVLVQNDGSAPRLEEVGDYIAVQVTGLLEWAGASHQVRIYSVPTDGEQALVACIASSGGTVEQMGWCMHLATTLVVESTFGKPLSLRDLEASTSWLRAEITDYEGKARSLREELRAARYSEEQERDAARLRALARKAALALGGRPNDPILLPAQTALRRSLARVADGYALMARAADRRKRSMWVAGARRVTAADAELASSFGQARIQ